LKTLGAIIIAGWLSTAYASNFSVTVTGNTTLSNTDLSNVLLTFPNFGSLAGLPVGATLTSVTLQITGVEVESSAILTNVNAFPATERYVASANFDATDSANASDSTNLDESLVNCLNGGTCSGVASTIFNSGPVTIFTGTTQLIPPTKTLTVTGTTIAGTTAAYAGAGTFTIGFSTLSSFTLSGANNVTFSQATQAQDFVTVVYNYSTPSTSGTPEPASMLLSGGGLLAVTVLGRKKFARRRGDSTVV
jgi:hypothetical protein